MLFTTKIAELSFTEMPHTGNDSKLFSSCDLVCVALYQDNSPCKTTHNETVFHMHN